MKRFRYPLAALALAGVLIAITIRLFNVDFSNGQSYPEYSSFRADPKGAKLLYDSLARVPGLNVGRNLLPVNTLRPNGATLLFIDCDPAEPGLDVLDALAKGGDRIVFSLPTDFAPEAPERFALRHWGLRFEKIPGVTFGADTHWRLSQAIGWTVIDQDASSLLAAEKPYGKGSLVVFAGSGGFANRSVYNDDPDDLSPVAKALGANPHIVFDESHLGVAESGSIIALAKRFRLTGIAAGFAILAALFIWRNTTAFPPARERNPRGAVRSASQGLETLLRRHVPVANLAADCWREWIASNRREFPEARIERAQAASVSLAKDPLAAARRVHEVLYSKGEF